MSAPKILVVVGTRPEAIKLAPVVRALRKTTAATVRLVSSAQHRDLLDDALRVFDLVPDHDLDVMTDGQSPNQVCAAIFDRFEPILAREKPDWVVVQGDTTTTVAAALCAFYAGARVAHVEAGLRTGDLANPFPEEANRAVVSRIATRHFPATATARDNLLREGIDDATISITGNPVIDALEWVRDRTDANPLPDLPANTRLVVLTAHRRESFGHGLEQIAKAILEIGATVHADADAPAIQVALPMHPNPRVHAVFDRAFAGHPFIQRLPPLSYPDFVALLDRAFLVMTDSGGVQEEAPSLGKPVLVLREKTERVEAVVAGTACLVGTDPQRIVASFLSLWNDQDAYRTMASIPNPYGDGRASERIAAALCHRPFSPFVPETAVSQSAIPEPAP